jgi:outer membrane lipoprotein-sorting protein
MAIPRRARWAVPAGVVAVVAAAATASAITVAQAAPALPARTPAQLLAAVAGQTAPPPALTGTVVETAALGIPQLPGVDDPTSLTSLLTGSHTIKIWYADPRHFRLAAPVTMGESDLIRNGRTVWLWQSSSNSVTKMRLPARPEGLPGAGRGPKPSLIPQQAARQALAALGPTTRVTTQSNVTVAGQPAYQLVLAPRDSRSLVGKVTIAVDGQHLGVPLRVQVFARGAKAPAISVGYTSISFVRPAAANFTFTPPKGAHVHTLGTPGGWYAYAPLSGQKLIPPPAGGWSGAPPNGFRKLMPARLGLHRLFAGRPWHLRQIVARMRVHGSIPRALRLRLRTGQVVTEPAAPPPALAQAPRVIGKGWLSVAVLPDSALGGLAGVGNAAGAAAAGQAARSLAGNGGPVSNSAIVAALLHSARPVHGAWGSGRLVHTSLISMLITNNGHVLVGAVAPSVLYADAAQVK